MSTNSKDAVRESYVLIIKLLERTRERKIAWVEADPACIPAKQLHVTNARFAYRTTLGNNLIATIWENDRFIGFRLMELNLPAGPPLPSDLNLPPKDYEREVLSICLDRLVAIDDSLTDETLVFEDLSALLALIQNAPNRQSDARIEQAKNYLDQLAS